jgi:hypothetical protein
VWPNIPREELVDLVHAWAERESVEPILVFEGEETADDRIAREAADVDGRYWLVTSDRELRERAGRRAERVIGGGSFARQVFPGARRGKQSPVSIEPGLDLHEWETRWQELQDLATESPADALPEMVRLAEQMLVERGYAIDNPAVIEGDDVVRSFRAARDLVTEWETGAGTGGDLGAALENLTDVHDFLLEERAAP